MLQLEFVKQFPENLDLFFLTNFLTMISIHLQWNLYKADTIGAKKVSAL